MFQQPSALPQLRASKTEVIDCHRQSFRSSQRWMIALSILLFVSSVLTLIDFSLFANHGGKIALALLALLAYTAVNMVFDYRQIKKFENWTHR